jgi:hypothetical protein
MLANPVDVVRQATTGRITNHFGLPKLDDFPRHFRTRYDGLIA